MLAELTPFLEQTAVYDALDLEHPLIGGRNQDPPMSVFPVNRFAVAQRVDLFLCPSDRFTRVYDDFGPANYVACAGSGARGGQAIDADGVFYINSRTRMADLTDGASHTVFMSESLLGPGGDREVYAPAQVDPATMYRFVQERVAELTDEVCHATRVWRTDRGAMWADGNYRHGLYNHWYPPNHALADCIRHSNPGWRGARSRHPGGANVLLGDGVIRFVAESVHLATWRALAARNSNQTIGAY